MSKKGLILGHTDVKRSKLRGIKALFDRSLDDKAACQRFLQVFQRKPAKHLLRLTPAIHTACFAPSGAGKNCSIVEPLLFTDSDSAFVTDIKGENAELTGRFREEVFGHKIMRLDPWHLTTDKPARWNVLDLIKPNDPEALDKARALAEAIVEKSPNDQQPHWPKKAQDFIAGAIGAVTQFCPPELRSLQQVAEILADKTLLAQVIEKMKHSSAYGGLLARKGYEMSASADKELDGILSTANQSLAFLSTLAVMESTKCTSDFDLSALYEGNGATIYPIIPLQYLKSHAPLMRLWLTAFTKDIVSRGIKNPRPVNVILDECAAVMAGHGDTLDEMLTVGRGFNMKVTAIFQTMAQLRKLFPQGQEGVLLANASLLFFAVNEVEDAKYVASRLGEETIIVQDWGTGDSESEQPAGQQGGKSKSYSRSRSLNFRQVARQLLKPEEVIGLHPRVALTFTPGRPPIWTWLTRYYEKSFGEPTGLSPAKMIFDSACMFVCSAMLAALWTAGLFHHWFR